jgi:hypothetical protein
MRVTACGEGDFVCQFERDEWVNFGTVPLPPTARNLAL